MCGALETKVIAQRTIPQRTIPQRTIPQRTIAQRTIARRLEARQLRDRRALPQRRPCWVTAQRLGQRIHGHPSCAMWPCHQQRLECRMILAICGNQPYTGSELPVAPVPREVIFSGGMARDRLDSRLRGNDDGRALCHESCTSAKSKFRPGGEFLFARKIGAREMFEGITFRTKRISARIPRSETQNRPQSWV